MLCFRVMDWFQSKTLLNKFVCGSLLLVIACIAPLNLYQSREDRDKLFMKLMLEIAFSAAPFTILIYSLTNTDLIKFHKKAKETFRPLQSEGPETYARITRFGRKVVTWLWGYFSFTLLTSSFMIFSKELRSISGFNDVIGTSRFAEGLLTAFIILTLIFTNILIFRHARWTYYIWAQIVLLKAKIKSRLNNVRISRYDKGEQKLCKMYLREVVRFYSDIKSFADDFYSHVRIGAMLLFIPGAGTAAIPILVYYTDLSMITKFALGTSMITVTLYLYLIVMNIQATIDESEKLGEVLYDCPWYNWDKNNCTTLIIMMSVMKRPLLKADVFGVIEINYRMCLTIYRVVYGFATAVLNMK